MDGRSALRQGTKLTFHNREGGVVSYVIQREIGRGGSCIVYDASYTDNLGNPKLIRIKECYPYGLRVTRHADDSLVADERDSEAYESQKRRLIDAYQQNHDLFSTPALTNYVSNSSDIYEAGGTVYIVSTWLNSETLSSYHCKTLRECALLLASVGRVIQRIHEAGFLYLDLKPENILTIYGSTDLVQLFDFDSMVSISALREAIQTQDLTGIRTSYTKGFAPLEQQTGKLRKLGWHSDVYSLGAVFFYELWGHTPNAFDSDASAVYDFDQMAFGGSYQDKLYWELTDFFHRTLASFTGDRYAAMSEAVAHLDLIAQISDDTLPWLYSTPIDAPVFFTGRTEELVALDELLHQPNQHIFSLYGLGGIGKSSFVREYLAIHRSEYDAMLYLHVGENPDELLIRDEAVRLNTIEKRKEESAEEYLPRKLKVLRKLSAEQNIIVVLDNYSPSYLEKTSSFFDFGWKILLVSRDELPEGFCPSMQVGELATHDMVRLFAYYSHCDFDSEERIAAFRSIVESIDGHTLLLELIGRQIARDYLSLSDAAILAREYGFSHISETKVDYIRDRQAARATIESILGQLLQVDHYTGGERHIMKLLSLFDAPGIPAQAFRVLADLQDMDIINELEDSGWLRVEHNWLSMHSVLREYVQNWPWQGDENYLASAEAFMERLYVLIKPEGKRLDSDKQYPEDYTRLWHLLRLAEQAVVNLGVRTPASQRLLYHLVMDAPVDQDELMLQRCLVLLKHPDHLDPDSVLRLYNEAAVLFRRLNYFEDALQALKEMKAYLLRHTQKTQVATKTPTQTPTRTPTKTPTQVPTEAPTRVPTQAPTARPVNRATVSSSRNGNTLTSEIGSIALSDYGASSELTDQYGAYTVSNCFDRNTNTTWAEGESGDGIGSTISGCWSVESGSWQITGVAIWAGYHKSSDVFYKNSRPRKVTLEVYSDGEFDSFEVNLSDSESGQYILFDYPIELRSEAQIWLTINSVYSGNKYTDTCITDIDLLVQ